MPKYLVIIEGPGKIKKVSAALGKDYKVVASKGHCIDLPAKGKNISVKKDKATGDYTFTPNYQILDDKKEIVSDLVDLAQKHQTTYLMMDPDREGEAIAWHIANQLPASVNMVRVTTNSITKAEIAKALKKTRSIDQDLVNSYEARRILDRLVGYECSFLTTQATGGRSVGRVQSAALRILADREKAIQAFVPEEYWEIKANLLSKKAEKLIVDLVDPKAKDIKNKKAADTIKVALEGNETEVTKYDQKQRVSRPYAPFTTSTMQQSAVSILGLSQSRAMRAAQGLYEDGHITYHRTDSISISSEGIKNIRGYIQANFTPNYYPSKPNLYKTSAKNAQEAHEAIRPTDANVVGVGRDTDQKRLYELIWQRAVASQMTDSVSNQVTIRFETKKYTLGVSGSSLVFDGWKKVWSYALSKDVQLPALKVGEKLDISKVSTEQKWTQPPPRFSEASITKELEKTGIGRPSTYEQTMRTLKDREYIELTKKAFHVTDLGLRVSDFLVRSNFCFIDLKFTADMEDDLDEISAAKKTKENVLNIFYKRLMQDMDVGRKMKDTISQTTVPCPDCSKMLLKKFGRQSVPFFACPDRKECGFTANIGADGKPEKKVAKQVVLSTHKCPICSELMAERSSKYGKFFGCSKFPKCRGMRDESGKEIKKSTGKKKWSKKTKKKTTKKK